MDDLITKLSDSERKRAQLLLEVGRLQVELQQAHHHHHHSSSDDTASRSGLGADQGDSSYQALRKQLQQSEHQRAVLERDLTNLRTNMAETAPAGEMHIQSVESPVGYDVAVTEEEEARAAAEEIMSQLLFYRRALQTSKDEVKTLRLEVAQAEQGLDAARSRELALQQMTDSYRAEIERLLTHQHRLEEERRQLVSQNVRDSELLEHGGGTATFHRSGPESGSGLRPHLERIRQLELGNSDLTARLKAVEGELEAERDRQQRSGAGGKSTNATSSYSEDGGAEGEAMMVGSRTGQSVATLETGFLEQQQYIRQQQDRIKALQKALKESMARGHELETLLRTVSTAS